VTVARILAIERSSRVWLALVVLAWGIQAIVTQSLLIREALVVMFGSEFAWGIVLFAWLLGVAVGGAFGGLVGPRLRQPELGLVVTLLLLSAAACAQLWVFRGLRGWLGVAPGELVSLPITAATALACVAPVGALVGFAFPLACCARDALRTRTPRRPASSGHADTSVPAAASPHAAASDLGAGFWSLGNVYAWESAGSLLGGVAFSFWAVERWAPIETALLCAALTTAACAGMLTATRRHPWSAAVLAPTAGALLGLMVLAGPMLDRHLIARRWRDLAAGYELCATVESKYQNLAIARRADQYTLYEDGHVAADFPDPYSYAPLAHLSLCMHPSPRYVLLLGGGAEGLLAEVLRHPIEHVDYVEPDPRKIALLEPYLPGRDRAALRDPRVIVHHGDARHYIKTQHGRFDLVLACLPEPISARCARFFTREFYGELRSALRAEGVFCTTVAATPTSLSPASARYVAAVRATLQPQFPEIIVGWDTPAMLLAATAGGLLSTDPEVLAQRYVERGVESDLFDSVWFSGATDWLQPDKVAQRARELDAVAEPDISTDLRPLIYLDRLILWERMTRGEAAAIVGYLRGLRLRTLVVGTVVLVESVLLIGYLRQRWSRGATTQPRGAWLARQAVLLSVAGTGLVTMALSIIWLFAFQNLYGYVYQRIGFIIAVFMGGLVIGCAAAQRLTRTRSASAPDALRHAWRRLIAVDVLLAALALLAPLALPWLGRLPATPAALVFIEGVVVALVVATGVLGGAAFALAGGLQVAATRGVGAAAGSIVGADHAGACIGALLTGLVLVPVFGTVTAALFLAGLKLCSAMLLALGRNAARVTFADLRVPRRLA